MIEPSEPITRGGWIIDPEMQESIKNCCYGGTVHFEKTGPCDIYWSSEVKMDPAVFSVGHPFEGDGDGSSDS